MLLKEVEPGMQVVVSEYIGTTLYTVKSVSDFNATLVYYRKGREINGGVVDVTCLKHPTVLQIEAAQKEKEGDEPQSA